MKGVKTMGQQISHGFPRINDVAESLCHHSRGNCCQMICEVDSIPFSKTKPKHAQLHPIRSPRTKQKSLMRILMVNKKNQLDNPIHLKMLQLIRCNNSLFPLPKPTIGPLRRAFLTWISEFPVGCLSMCIRHVWSKQV
jgi:hypothetical protein